MTKRIDKSTESTALPTFFAERISKPLRITAAIKYMEDNHFVRYDPVVNPIWKTSGKQPVKAETYAVNPTMQRQ